MLVGSSDTRILYTTQTPTRRGNSRFLQINSAIAVQWAIAPSLPRTFITRKKT